MICTHLIDSNDPDRPFGYDAFKRECLSHTVLEMLASKWVYLLVSALGAGPRRHGQLARRVEGITPKMLTQTLRGLERDGLVRRQVFPVIPPHVEYELTDLGRNLAGLLDQIRVWSEQHAPDIHQARTLAGVSREE